MLPRIQIAQIGDVHLPGAFNAHYNLDDKDPRFPADLRSIIARQPIRQVFEEIYRQIEQERLAAALFMGDFTDFGEIGGYRNCAQYIARALQLGREGKYSALPVGIVPGNHDIDRKLAASPGIATKFNPLAQALAEAGLPKIPVMKPVWMSVGSEGLSAEIAILNSCWGCGAKEFIPEEFREEVANAIEVATTGGHSERAVRAYYDRQFDTPAFSIDTVESLIKDCESVPTNKVLIACAHHNLLPQRLTRLAPYTELVNSGALRGSLQELDRPVIYLHGHIHEDPIEIIQAPAGAPLVCISAPEASKGFNVLEFRFTRGLTPLSCGVHKWRFDASHILRAAKPVLISLTKDRHRSERRKPRKIFAHLVNSSEVYWSELLTFAQDVFSSNAEEQLEEVIEFLVAEGRVNVDNYDLPPANWILGAKV
jgi:hypothetical protein